MGDEERSEEHERNGDIIMESSGGVELGSAECWRCGALTLEFWQWRASALTRDISILCVQACM